MHLLTHKPILLCCLLCAFVYTTICAQEPFPKNNTDRRNPAIGLHYSVSNFSRSPFVAGRLNHGYALSFLDGIAGKFDYMVQGGSISPRYALGKEQPERRHLLHHINIYGMRRLLVDTVLFNPFVGAGPGICLYDGQLSASIQGAAGLQLRISPVIYLHTQVSYHVNLSSSINNSVSASIGLLGTILHRRKQQLTTVQHISAATGQQPADRDGDGIPDLEDDCPTVPGPGTYKGCPDTDGDGISDNKDECPTTPGLAMYKGCPAPEEKAPLSVAKIDTLTAPTMVRPVTDSVTNALNELAQFIYFETNKATLTPSSTGGLQKIVALLKTRSFSSLVIEGHTDNTGTDRRNAALSKERAQTVLNYLTKAGIDVKKLTAKGFGATRPVADNATAEGRAQNRRTVFVLYE